MGCGIRPESIVASKQEVRTDRKTKTQIPKVLSWRYAFTWILELTPKQLQENLYTPPNNYESPKPAPTKVLGSFGPSF